MTSPDDYRAIHERAAIGAIAERRQIAVAGPDRASFLHGLLTNDIQSLTAGHGCYAAWLTPQGRMLCDLHVIESGDMILLDVPAEEVTQIAERLEQFHFGENVQIASLADSLRAVWVHGPQAGQILAVAAPREGTPYDEWASHENTRTEIDGMPVVVARIDQLNVPGYAVYTDVQHEAAVTSAIARTGALHASPTTLEAVRIEAGYPIFGIDMTHETIPLEAGIEDRAISMTKGCYVGQEVIIRVLHRGGGRVARRLVRLQIQGDVPQRGAKVFSSEREIGFVTSAAESPRLGAIGLAYLHRDFVEGGSEVQVDLGELRERAIVAG
jgi:folate-binding protein YgfZ